MTHAPLAPAPLTPARFEEPWHAQVFALAVALNEAGHFTWPEWTELFGANLQTLRAANNLTGDEGYYVAWVSALEQMMIQKDIVAPDALTSMKSLWTEAFLNTPHGAPVSPRKPA